MKIYRNAYLILCVTSSGCAGSVARLPDSQRTWISTELIQGVYTCVPGILNGHKVNMILDTGSTHTAIDDSFAKKLGLDLSGVRIGSAYGGPVNGRFARDMRLRIGDIEKHGLEMFVTSMVRFESVLGRTVSVIVGADFLSTVVADFDFPNNRVAFLSPKSFIYDGNGATIPARDTGNGVRSIPLTLNRATVCWAQIDTAHDGLTLSAPFDRTHAIVAGIGRHSEWYMGGAGGRVKLTVATIDYLGFGPFVLREVPFSVVDTVIGGRSCNAAIGMEILRRFRVITDFPHNLIHVEPAPNWQSKPFRRDLLGICPGPDTDGLNTALVAPGSPADVAGWKLGMRIVAVNGKAGSPQELRRAMRAVLASGAKSVRLRDGKGETWEIPLQTYY